MVTKQDEETPWQYNPSGKEAVENLPDNDDVQSAESAPAPSDNKSLSWQAPEFIAHPHPAGWYAGLLIVTVVLTAFVYLITKDYIATGTILLIGMIVAMSAARKPGIVSYELTSVGLSINDKKYPYGSFKSFSILREGDMSSVNFFPLKRFMPLVSIYLSRAEEDKVINTIGNHLPYEQRQMDSVDRLSRRLRF